MNREDIIDMAQKAGIGQLTVKAWSEELECFFHLAVAAEREACANLCENMGRGHGSAFAEFDCAAAIRARGEK